MNCHKCRNIAIGVCGCPCAGKAIDLQEGFGRTGTEQENKTRRQKRDFFFPERATEDGFGFGRLAITGGAPRDKSAQVGICLQVEADGGEHFGQ